MNYNNSSHSSASNFGSSSNSNNSNNSKNNTSSATNRVYHSISQRYGYGVSIGTDLRNSIYFKSTVSIQEADGLNKYVFDVTEDVQYSSGAGSQSGIDSKYDCIFDFMAYQSN